jgi:hypothetical protein
MNGKDRNETLISFDSLYPFSHHFTLCARTIIHTEINASRRLKEAAAHKAEADKVRQVKGAEAEAEARYLSGLGVARQRKAIVSGLQASVSEFSDAVEGTRPSDVMNILLLSQYMDTLSVVGANSLILEHDPATVTMLQSQVSKSFSKSRK